ncbi:GntR family transcriptional regulator [uncultured Cedecea sp.]|uniref:GntR family transcriptional regulator n=1 Tax=uncultured Cedecea sp. TaxID=988762 RepID=UPI0026248B0B|nr:GntR family transcriptional regulator [uncultured Cedecea sp.]
MVYKDVIILLKSKIASPAYNIGDILPTEKELAELYNVSRNTLRKALKVLEDEEFIERRHGSGTYIRNKHFQTSVTHMDSFTEIAKKEGKKANSQVLRFELQTASEDIAGRLRLAVGDPVYYSKRLRFIDNIPMQLEETWMSVNRFPDLTINHMKQSKFSYIEKQCGVQIIGCFESFQPVHPTHEIAKLLHISSRDPIIKMETQSIDESNNPVDYTILYNNAFEFQVKYFLSRKMLTHVS